MKVQEGTVTVLAKDVKGDAWGWLSQLALGSTRDIFLQRGVRFCGGSVPRREVYGKTPP